MNIQPMSHQDLRPEGSLCVHSMFPTIQGEGPFAGVPATFIRLAGCNLQCPGCDTDYTSGPIPTASPDDIVKQVEFYPHPLKAVQGHLVVITGGEPFRQNIGPAVRALLSKGYRVQIETNGTLYAPGPWTCAGVTIVCSPKTRKINETLRPLISAYKYVVDEGNVAPDGLPYTALDEGDKHVEGLNAATWVARPPRHWGGPIYIQPMDSYDPWKNDLNLQTAIESCQEHGYILCLQLHKILRME